MKPYYKYPRTPHLPWSPGGTKDDAYLIDVAHFEGREVVVTEKMDGENTSMYSDKVHARSIDGRHHPSRNWVKALHGRVARDIPTGWRFCGENLFAEHSIRYDNLSSYFYLFSVWNELNEAISWDQTVEWATLLGVDLVPVLYRGLWDESVVRELTLDLEAQEGYVVRVAERFPFDAFPTSVAKWVRQGHVQTDQHWMHSQIRPNGLSGPSEESP